MLTPEIPAVTSGRGRQSLEEIKKIGVKGSYLSLQVGVGGRGGQGGESKAQLVGTEGGWRLDKW